MNTLEAGWRQNALLTVREMAQADRLSVLAGVSSFELMGNAGAAVAREIERRWTPQPLVVLCGPGNNGGDGFVTAHRLAEAGWSVRVAMWGDPNALKGEAGRHAQRWQGKVQALSPAVLDGAQLIVDALFGAGLSRALEGAVLDTLAAAGRGQAPIIAIDTPSGVMGDTGEALGAVAAVVTVTFFRKKPGHLLSPGRGLCGEVIVADIGTPDTVFDTIAPLAFENHPALWRADLPRAEAQERALQDPGVLIVREAPVAYTGDTLSRTRAAARDRSTVMVVQGRDTLVAAPDGRAILHPPGPSTTDADDVLNAIIQRLLAQGMPAFSAAAAGVWLHDAAVAESGPGLQPKDVPRLLPRLYA